MPTSNQIDCDTAPVPVPPGGHIEGVSDYACSGGDCHLLVYQGMRLYELYQGNISGGMATGGTFHGDCLVVWDLTKDYWANPSTVGAGYSRGDGCNGADAGDFPMAPLIIKTAEIQTGVIAHAMRFTLPNPKIRANVYVHPMTHLGGPSGGATMLPYGARLRLKASFDETKLPSEAAKVVARALKKYGMFLADGGNPYISATDDIGSVLSGSATASMQPGDFEWVDSGGPRVNYGMQNCTRTPITQ
jgi:serine/threonine-protein kinase